MNNELASPGLNHLHLHLDERAIDTVERLLEHPPTVVARHGEGGMVIVWRLQPSMGVYIYVQPNGTWTLEIR